MLLILLIVLLTLSLIADRYFMINLFFDVHIKSNVFLIVDVFYQSSYCEACDEVRQM